MATHSSVLAWRIPGTGKPGGLPSLGSHRVGHDWSDLTAVVAAAAFRGPRASCFSLPGAGPGSPACAVGPQARPLTRSRACPLPLAVLADMAAPSLPAWLALQTRARTLRAFSTAVSPVTGAPRLSPRECLPRRLRALGAVSERNTGAWWRLQWRSQSHPGDSSTSSVAGHWSV